MKRLFCVVLLALFFCAQPARAVPIITYTLSLNDNGSGVFTPGSLAVYAAVTMDNPGLAAYQIQLTGYTTLANVSPRTVYDDGTGNTTTAGFTFSRSGTNINPIIGAEDTVAAKNGDATLIYGFGQTADNFAAHNPFVGGTQDNPKTQTSWSAPLLIATGTFNPSGPTPAFDAFNPTQGNVFNPADPTGTEHADVNTVTVSLPEPVSMTYIAAAWTIMIGIRRPIRRIWGSRYRS